MPILHLSGLRGRTARWNWRANCGHTGDVHGPRDKGKMVARDRAGLAQGPVGARKSGHIALTQMLRHGTGLASDPSAPG